LTEIMKYMEEGTQRKIEMYVLYVCGIEFEATRRQIKKGSMSD